MISRVQSGKLNNIETLIILEKLGKAASNAIANKTITTAVNRDLVEATKQREKRKQENQEDSSNGSYGRVMGRKEMERRKAYHLDKRFIEATQQFAHTAFVAVFTVKITKQDKGINPCSQKSSAKFPRRLPTKPPQPQQLLLAFSNLVLPPLLGITASIFDSSDPLQLPPIQPGPKAVKKATRKVVKKTITQLVQSGIESLIEVPKTTRSGRVVKRTKKE